MEANVCNKLCRSIWAQDDRSPLTGKLRGALYCHAIGSYETARGLYEQTLTELTDSHPWAEKIQEWIKAAAAEIPLPDRLRRDVKAHDNQLRQIELPGFDPRSVRSSMSPAAVTQVAAEYSAKARSKLAEIPAAARASLKLVSNG
jgi:hypothetical protein